MKLLFISRAYPPVIGGIENHNFELAKRFPKSTTTTIVNTRGKKFLPIFLPYALLITLVSARKYDAILFGDGVLSIIGFVAGKVSKKTRTASVIHGLDITYRNPLYQLLWVRIFLPCLDTLIAVSNETKNTAVQHGLNESKIKVIPNGIEQAYTPNQYPRTDLSALLQFDVQEKIILLTHGRLAKRKGVNWFIQNVLPGLPDNIHYVVSGDGPERETILDSIKIHGLENRVTLVGRISEETKKLLLHTVDIFIQPNITVVGDMEGFGIAVIEATSLARPVIVSNIEGLKDAVAEGKNGIALASGDSQAWRECIVELANDREKRIRLGLENQKYTVRHFDWNTITNSYMQVLSEKKQG